MAPVEAKRPSLLVTLVATVFGAGLSPKAPGTCGTVMAVPLAWGLDKLGQPAFLAGMVLVSVIGTLAAHAYVRATGKDDDQRIVIDEVAGYLVTLAPVARTPVHLALAFVLFRLFDIWKPQPVRWVDRHVGGGFGVMADDLAAGVYGAAVLFALDHFGVVARIAAWLKL